MDISFFILTSIIFLAYFVGATTGFGSAIIALTLAVHLFPIDFLVPVVVPLNVVVFSYLTVRHRIGIDRRLFFRQVLPFTLLGMPIGFLVFHLVQTDELKRMFGAFVLCLSLFELAHIVLSKKNEVPPIPYSRSIGWLFGGGVIQGLWVSGGPLIAYWAGRNLSSKQAFRSTLSALWLVLNAFLLAGHAATGKMTLETGKMSAALLPAMACGVALGEWLHGRLPERTFRILVFSILMFAGGSILLRG